MLSRRSPRRTNLLGARTRTCQSRSREDSNQRPGAGTCGLIPVTKHSASSMTICLARQRFVLGIPLPVKPTHSTAPTHPSLPFWPSQMRPRGMSFSLLPGGHRMIPLVRSWRLRSAACIRRSSPAGSSTSPSPPVMKGAIARFLLGSAQNRQRGGRSTRHRDLRCVLAIRPTRYTVDRLQPQQRLLELSQYGPRPRNMLAKQLYPPQASRMV